MKYDYAKANEDFTKDFQTEAATVLSPKVIQELSTRETARLTRAKEAKIPLTQFWTGANSSRRSKDLVRSRQPFYALYVLLSFGTECSMLLLFLRALQWGITKLIPSINSLLFLPVACAIPVYLLWKYIALFAAGIFLDHAKDATQQTASKIRLFRLISGDLFLVLLILFLWRLSEHTAVTIDQNLSLSFVFGSYVLFALLSGIHNVLYSSHFLTFFSIGWYSFLPKYADKQQEYLVFYSKQVLKKRLSEMRNKTKDLTEHPELQKQLLQSIISRQITYRIYSLLACLIFVVLLVLCIYQMRFRLQLSVLLLGLFSLLAICILAIVLRSCNAIITYVRSDLTATK